MERLLVRTKAVLLAGVVLAAATIALSSATVAQSALRSSMDQTCKDPSGGLGVSRVVEIDASAGPLFGEITTQVKEDSFLKPKEVVLTFDDGPMPWVTNSILDTLDTFCTKATFFAVGKMAIAYPATLRKVIERGHTLGGHTWSHPLNLKRLGHTDAMNEIEKGLAAISLASGGQVAPFFRFPGLSDNAKMLTALQQRGIASFSVDVVSDDSYISNPAKLVATTLSRLEARKRGILLFHDIKPATAKALPTLLAELKKRGYRVVHMRGTANLKPLEQFTNELQPVLAKKDPPQGQAAAKAAMLPFFGSIGPERIDAASTGAPKTAIDSIEVDTITSSPRDRSAAAKASDKKETGKATASLKSPSGDVSEGKKAKDKSPQSRDDATHSSDDASGKAVTLHRDATGDKWSAQIRRERLNRTLFD